MPVVKPVSVKLPQPEETCIIKQVLLPRVECQKVSAVSAVSSCLFITSIQYKISPLKHHPLSTFTVSDFADVSR